MPSAIKAGFLRMLGCFGVFCLVPFAARHFESTFGSFHMPALIGIMSVLWGFGFAAIAQPRNRLRLLLSRHPESLCVRCEHPLPPDGGLHEDLITCTECGLTRPRDDHREDWKRWVTGGS